MGCIGFFDFADHRAKFDFFDLQQLDYSKSGDEKSPDTDAIYATQLKSYENRFGPEYMSIMNGASCAASFDGASVMIGKNDSVTTRWIRDFPLTLVIHAVAHRLESAYAD